MLRLLSPEAAKLLQYRDKLSPPTERVARARALLEITHHFDAKLIINDDLPLAILINADGLHLGKDDGNLAAARAIIGPEKILGASCYNSFEAAINRQSCRGRLCCFGAAFRHRPKPDAPNRYGDPSKGQN